MAKLENAPVFFTIAQIRHNALLTLDRYLPEIQDAMRKAGYADYREQKQQTLVFSMGVGEGGPRPPATEARARYLFGSADRTRAFVLFNDSISFETTRYETWPQFRDALLHGARLVSDIVGGYAFSDRLGLRYLDAVIPKPGESVREYINREFHGLPAHMPNTTLEHSISEAKLHAPETGSVVARVLIQSAALALPAELTVDLAIDPRFAVAGAEHALLDTDGFWETRDAFDLAAIEHRFDRIHAMMVDVFKSIVSQQALTRWA